MPKQAKELSAIEVRQMVQPGLHAVGGVTGLYLTVAQTRARSWILRVKIGNKRREMGLGGFPDVTLADARAKARIFRQQISEGIDPVEQKAEARIALKREQDALTFKEAVELFFDTKKRPEFSSDRHAKIWINSLRSHIYPHIGRKRIGMISSTDILEALQPVWLAKPQTGKKVRQRLEQVFEWAKVRGHCHGGNPARWAGNLRVQLPSPEKVSTPQPHPAVQIDHLRRWFSYINDIDGVGALALRFLALTVGRSSEVRLAKWDEIDLVKRMWVVPPEHIKTRKVHRVALSDAAVEMLEVLPRFLNNDLVFPAPRGGVMSDATISTCMKRIHELDDRSGGAGFIDQRTKKLAVPHGLRSSFRDWVAERTNHSREIAEIALSHEVGSDVERAYRRTDMIEKRRQMMNDWADQLKGG